MNNNTNNTNNQQKLYKFVNIMMNINKYKYKYSELRHIIEYEYI